MGDRIDGCVRLARLFRFAGLSWAFRLKVLFCALRLKVLFCVRNAWLFTFAAVRVEGPLAAFDRVNCCVRTELPLLPLLNWRLPLPLLLLANWRLPLPLLLEAIDRLRLPPDDELELDVKVRLPEVRTFAELRLPLFDDWTLGPELRDTDVRLPPPLLPRWPLAAAASSIVTK